MCLLLNLFHRIETRIVFILFLGIPFNSSKAQTVEPPQQPFLLVSKNSVTLYWQPPKTGIPNAYIIYRGTEVENLTKIKQVALTESLIFTDTLIAGYNYYYAISAIFDGGIESRKSTIISKSIPAELVLTSDPNQISAGESFNLKLVFAESIPVIPMGYLSFTLNWNSSAVQLNPKQAIRFVDKKSAESIGLRTVPQQNGILITILPKQLSGIRADEFNLSIPFEVYQAETIEFSVNRIEAEDLNQKKVEMKSSKIQKMVYRPVISAPKELKAHTGNRKVVLTWSASENEDINLYRVYRKSESLKNVLLKELESEQFAQPIFVDTTVENHKTYVYSVTAVHKTSYESHVDKEVSARPELPYSENLQAYFPFNERLQDESWHETPIWVKQYEPVSDRFGRKSAFAIADSESVMRIRLGKNSWNADQDFTLSFWIYTDSVTSYQSLVSFMDSTINAGWSLSILNGLPMMKITYPDKKVYNATALFSLKDSVWNQLIWSYQSENNRISLSINAYEYTEEWEKVLMPECSPQELIWGGMANAKERKTVFHGKVDDVRWYNTCLSATEKHGLFTTEAAPAAPKNLLAAPSLNQIELTWSMSHETDFKRYKLYLSEDGEKYSLVYSTRSWAQTDTSIVLTGLIEDQPYFLYLKAEDQDGWESESSDTVQVIPIDTGFLLINGLTHYWHFDERFGSNAYDQLNFVPIEASSRRFFTAQSPGISKTCADLTSGKSYLDLRTISKLEKQWTVSFWLKWNHFSEYESVLRLHDNQELQYALLRGYAGQQLEFYLNEKQRYTILSQPELNKWYYLVLAQTEPGKISFYINSNLVRTIQFDGEDIIKPQAFGLNDWKSLSHYGSFYLDELSIYDRAISENDIRALYQNGKSLVFPFEDESMYPLFPPVHVRAEPLPKSVLITWQSQEVFHMDYHKIYRGSTPENLDSIGYVPFRDEKVSLFMDMKIQENKTYYYAVSVVNLDGKESLLSQPILATMARVDEESIWLDTSSVLSPLSFTPTIRFETVPGSFGYVVNVVGPGFFTSDFVKVNGYMIPSQLNLNADYTITIQSLFKNDSVAIQGPVTTKKIYIKSSEKQMDLTINESKPIQSEVIRELKSKSLSYKNEEIELLWGDSPNPDKGLNWLSLFKEQMSLKRIKTVGFSANDMVTIPIQSGWNLIRNPFDEVFRFADASKSSSPLLFWNGQGFQTETLLKTDVFYYWFNDSQKKELELSYFDLIVVNEELEILYTDDWSSEWFVSTTFPEDSGFGRIELEMSNRVVFPEQYEAPLAPFEMNRMAFSSHKRKDDSGLPIKYVFPKPDFSDGNVGIAIPIEWKIPNKNTVYAVTITDSVSHWPKEAKRYVVNETKGWLFPMKNDGIQLNDINFDDDWLLVIGNDDYIEEMKETIKPEKPHLFDTFVNWNSQEAFFRYALPTIDYTSLKVHDVYGRNISTPVHSIQLAGEHEVNVNVEQWSKGFYKYELSSTFGYMAKLMRK